MLAPNSLAPKQKRSTRKRLGRGNATGTGTYAGRGLKGQRSRSGGKGGLKLKGLKATFKSIPKVKGFTSAYVGAPVVNVSELDAKYVADSVVRVPQYKVLGHGELTKKLTVYADSFTASAKIKIEAKGGKAISCGKSS